MQERRKSQEISFALQPSKDTVSLPQRKLLSTTEQLLLRCKEKKQQLLNHTLGQDMQIKKDNFNETTALTTTDRNGFGRNPKELFNRTSRIQQHGQIAVPPIHFSGDDSRLSSKQTEKPATLEEPSTKYTSELKSPQRASVSPNLYMHLTQKLFTMNVKYSKQSESLAKKRIQPTYSQEVSYYSTQTHERSAASFDQPADKANKQSPKDRSLALENSREQDKQQQDVFRSNKHPPRVAGFQLDQKVDNFLSSLKKKKLRQLTSRC